VQKTDAHGTGTNYNSEPNEIKMAIKNAVNIALFLHRSPDLDSLCSNFAMHAYLESIKKPHTLFSIDRVPNAYELIDTSFIKANEDPAKLDFSPFDMVIGIDMAAPSVSTQDKNFKHPKTTIRIKVK
jgi:nanoRNase/pAp phosphatase (c-di-AMP/oligoRNAs hydrolase)